MPSLLNQSSFTDSFIYVSKVSNESLKQITDVWKRDHKLYGSIGKVGSGKYSPHIKQSTDISIFPKNFDNAFPQYMKELNILIRQYTLKYKELNENTRHLAISEPINIQKYKKGEGFFVPHFERANEEVMSRVLVFMTYLTNNPGCGTYFKYQDVATDAIKGNTVIWPAEFTHVHNGLVDFNKEKLIITGWVNIVPPPQKPNPLPGQE